MAVEIYCINSFKIMDFPSGSNIWAPVKSASALSKVMKWAGNPFCISSQIWKRTVITIEVGGKVKMIAQGELI